MFIKVVENSAWDFDDITSSQIKISSKGLSGSDKQAFVKRASAELADKVASMEFKPGEIPVHLIALGTTESYGPNRNGDGFSRVACKEYHPYFVKDAMVYRNHKNTDKKESYGIVKASAFNKEMDRVELVVALNGTKEAAEANKGHIADKEMEKLDSNKDVPVSMACTPDKDMEILTRERGYLPICRVAVGMHVWTKECRWKQVTQLNRRKYTGKLYTFYIQDLPFPLQFTENHPLWMKTGESTYEWVFSQDITLDMEATIAKTPDVLIGRRAKETITSMITPESNLGWLSTKDKHLFLQIRDYCLSHSLYFSSSNLQDKTEEAYGLVVDTNKTGYLSSNENLYHCPIKKIVMYDVKNVPVYNLEVEEDASYCAYGIISHNCKVPFDCCSYCGNKAVTRDDYCRDTEDGGHCKAGGLYHNMGKTASVDGQIHQLYADNTEPYFFDISHVFIPADRIAYTTGMLKRSSAGILSGSELAEFYGMYSTNFNKEAGFKGMTPDYRHAVRSLCNAVTDFHTGHAWKTPENYLSVMDTAPLQNVKVASAFSYSNITAALNATKRCLTPSQFLQVTTGTPYDKAVKIAEVIAPLSNEVFSTLLVEDRGDNPYMRSNNVPERLRNWSMQQKCASWNESAMRKQAAMNSLGVWQPHLYDKQTIYTLQEDPHIRNLSENYALYKTAFISSLPQSERATAARLLVGRDYLSF